MECTARRGFQRIGLRTKDGRGTSGRYLSSKGADEIKVSTYTCDPAVESSLTHHSLDPLTPPNLQTWHRTRTTMSQSLPSQSANNTEETSDRPNPVDADYEPSDHKRVATAHPTPAKRRQAKSSLLTFQRRNVDDEARKLEPGADSTYCVVTRASPAYTIIKYTHVLGAATSDEVVGVGQNIYCSAA